MIEFLQSWYAGQCNGFWEHGNGITIETLESSGWSVTIDLAETQLETYPMPAIRNERSPRDWMWCSVEHKQFRGEGDASKLAAILGVFQAWAGADRGVLN